MLGSGACQHDNAPVKPGDPIPAEPDVNVDTWETECNGLSAAILAYGTCPNADDDERAWLKALAESADQSFAAGKKGAPDADAQRVIAHACHRATDSVKHAHERCMNGKRPPPSY